MFESDVVRRRIGMFAWVMAWVGLVVGQLHALARHQTVDGRADLDLWATRVWAEPAGRALRPLLDWGSPDLVYVTYGKIWLPVFLAFTLCAFVVHHDRRPAGFEKWAWRIALTGYVWACVGVFGDYWTQWTSHTNALLDIAFVVGLPGLLLVLLGSTSLGISLLLNGFAPRASAWLLTITLPFAFVITMVTSLGSVALPVMFAFALAGRRLRQLPPAEAYRTSRSGVIGRSRTRRPTAL